MAEDYTFSELERAVRSERYHRAQAILGLPELIAGIQVEPLTYERLEWLNVAGNPFVCGGVVATEDGEPLALPLMEFIWFVSPDWKLEIGSEKPLWQEFLLKHRDLNLIDAREGIDEYLDRAFLDCTGIEGGVSFYSQTAGAYQALNASYPGGGWTMKVVKKTPLRIALQLIKAADRDRGCTVQNRRSSKLIGQYLSEIEHFELTIESDFESEMDAFVDAKCAEGYVLCSEPVQKLDKTIPPSHPVQATMPWIVPMRKGIR